MQTEAAGQVAPLVIGVLAKPDLSGAKPKPEWEQLLSGGYAAYDAQLAAKAQGFDNVWMTGLWVDSRRCAKHSAAASAIKSSAC